VIRHRDPGHRFHGQVSGLYFGIRLGQGESLLQLGVVDADAENFVLDER